MKILKLSQNSFPYTLCIEQIDIFRIQQHIK